MTAAELDPDVERLNQLVTDNHYQEAYDLSLQLMKAHEGEPEFDFLYGLSALEIGRPNESVFAFERVIAAYPDQMRVKLEMARAFYLLNNYQSSRDLFNEVLATNPTDNVKANIKVFLDLIEQKENNTTGSFSWYVNANAGTDSNINSATDLGVISTPIGNVTLSASGKSISDNFTELGGGVSYSKPFSKNSGLTVTANLSHHDNTSTNDFDLDVLSGDATYSNLLGDARMSYGVRTQRIDLNSSHFQDSNSAIVAMQRAPGNGWLQVLTGAYTMVRYDTSTNANASLRDVNQALVSGTLGRTMGRFNHAVSVYYGDESAVNPAGANNAQQFYGVAFSEQYQLSYTHIPYFRLTFHHSDNKSTDPIFNVERSDRMMSASLGWTWLMKRNITVTSDLTYTSNDSNIQLYGYDRTKFQTGIRYQF
ncbi:MAG TPA: outer membrane beta-barrel protein [Candidatus Acidoferrum sp.]|nr:outer membrane beta-barrel protein [Candidatus Acidoferrum sp.]